MSTETIEGLTVRAPRHVVDAYPELVERLIEDLLANLAARVTAKGLKMLDEPRVVSQIPVAVIKVAHHEHGWQLEEHQVRHEDAEYLLIVAEVACAPR